ncbi:MAG: chemotaxis protein CheA [Lachnospiraceae bacterium]|nr:chemotaxis protein CheA [Lachnospiraceae bacterium]
MDVSQYLEIFIDEAKEHLENLNTQIMNLEQDGENMDTINEIFRAAHSLKGMSGTMGFKRMQTLTHDMEDVFSKVRDGNIKVDSDMVDILFQCLDALEAYVAIITETADEGDNDNAHLIKALNDILTKGEGGNAGDGAGASDNSGADASGSGSGDNAGNGSEDNAAGSGADGSAGAGTKSEAPSGNAGNASDGKHKWKQIKIGNVEKSAIEDAVKDGLNAFGISIFVQETCLLKAARAFLVFRAMEELGEVILSVPSVQDIEDERFDRDFSVIFLTDQPLEKVIDAIKNVSEIEDAVGDKVTFEEAGSLKAEEGGTAGPAKDGATAGAQGAAGGSAGKGTQSGKAAAGAGGKPEGKKAMGKPVVNRTVRVDIEKLDSLMNLVSELIISKNSLVSVAETEIGASSLAFNEQIEYLESVTTSLHESVMKVRMVPIESVVTKFPRMIRDLSKKLDKKMELYMTGEDTELDRTVVDEIGDPLMHLLRNSADHGLESAEVRAKRGKPEVGSIFLDAYQDGNNVVIEVRDDGNGIDVEAVKKKAIEKGTITPEMAENMSEKEAIDLLFQPSFSTAKQVSDVSGRGVGLDVVKSKIESLSGEVEVRTKLGEGSTFTIRLPLTLAIIQTLMVIVGGEKYAISLGSIQTIESIPVGDVKTVQGKEVIYLRGNVIPLVRLTKELDVESMNAPDADLLVLIAKKGDRYAGIVVDELIGQMEIVIKNMGKFIGKSKLITGATILGNGEVALILDANALI